jgi:hypothetical protein
MISKLLPKGVRLLRRFPITRYLRLNVSKHGIGIAVGRRGASISLSPLGKLQLWLGLPGTGLGYRKQIDIRQLLSALLSAGAILVERRHGGSTTGRDNEHRSTERSRRRRPGRIRRNNDPKWRAVVEEAKRISQEYLRQRQAESQNREAAPNENDPPFGSHPEERP